MRHFVCVLLATFLCIAGCQSQSSVAPPKHYHLEGEVISVDAPKRLITVNHGDIPGFMSAMTMQYEAAEGEPIDQLKPGDKITADLVVGENVGHLEKITVVSKAPVTTTPVSPPSQPH